MNFYFLFDEIIKLIYLNLQFLVNDLHKNFFENDIQIVLLI